MSFFPPRLLVPAILPALLASGWAAAPDSVADWREKMQPLVPRGYVCRRASGPVRVDGKLDDKVWAAAPWTKDFADIEGAAKPKPRFRTRAKMLWDDEYFYIAAELEEPHVWATLTKHDAVIFRDPDFEVFMDPDGDAHRYFEFEINALNTGWDLFLAKPYKDGGKADNGWEIPGLKTAVHIRGTLNDPTDTDRGWSVELAFPWRALAGRAGPPRAGEVWRVGLSRVAWQIAHAGGRYTKRPGMPEDNWTWTPQGVIDMHRPERWGRVQFAGEKTAALVRDVAQPARDALQEIYYAQRAYRKAHGRWAAQLAELGLTAASPHVGAPRVRATAGGWEAEVELRLPKAAAQTWSIRYDARIWSKN
ncbi:MAG: carbohydrate-binding family 9-like protein [Chthoniobacter sp.]|nr:carbohydrate-binding family 9-like protein [Chthoniobacter sp.]